MQPKYTLDPTKPLTFWDYTHADVKDLIRHPDYNLDRFSRICAAVDEATQIIQRAFEEGKIS